MGIRSFWRMFTDGLSNYGSHAMNRRGLLRSFAAAALLAWTLGSVAPAQTYKDSGGTIIPGIAHGGVYTRNSRS